MDPIENSNGGSAATIAQDVSTLSKNKLKKIKKDQEWEANRELRNKIRKQKVQQKKLKKRIAQEEAASQVPVVSDGRDDESLAPRTEGPRRHRMQPVQLPVTILIDCGFDELMRDHERKSLESQVTRCYSDNHKAPYQAHLMVSSFGGHLKERFDNLLCGNHRSWKGVRFLDEDFAGAAKQAQEWMRAPDGGELAGALANLKPLAQENGCEEVRDGEIVYLTSDSPNTLSCLKPYGTYIIGGIVDKNRHKGICYKKALEADITTAKLPIGDYMQMNSRFVLATNHVSEILVRWLECGDWGQAFNRVMPKRKGGVLKEREAVVSQGSIGTEEQQQDREVIDNPSDVAKDAVMARHVDTGTEQGSVDQGGDGKIEDTEISVSSKLDNI